MTAGVTIAVLLGALFVAKWARNVWLADMASDDADPAPDQYVCDVRVQRKSSGRAPFVPLTTLSGFMRLWIRGHNVRISAPGMPRLLAAALGLDHHLEAQRFEAHQMRIQPSFSIGVRVGEGVLLNGSTRRGHRMEYTLVPRGGDVATLMHELARAGVRVSPPSTVAS